MNRIWIACTAAVLATGIGLMTMNDAATAAANRAPTLTNDETNNIEVFQAASPSVVFVTNTQLRRQRFSLLAQRTRDSKRLGDRLRLGQEWIDRDQLSCHLRRQ